MFAPSQQSMSAAEQQTKTWLTSVAITSATMEAVEKHAIDKNQRANSEDTNAAQELKKEEAMPEVERVNKIVATFANKSS
ncbi:hypothetical protein AK812_SmicGene33488 [Symbiodinium microadriaticum]|uniref:Uncharacterized protein n=1 Tax=Symbiodinium microadriaticum TaxID=2951 RepID=A0A1Q9CRJ6_SYMMI|nr:hypothetical protein AK812_SmicGene33488 [Symbiodinium microadriaticum]CAE7217879.1 unnamed protein product [Symbiodinium sp. KB8]CAE7225618.1 unnamed protein product [Symbiodinium microadriaticum]